MAEKGIKTVIWIKNTGFAEDDLNKAIQEVAKLWKDAEESIKNNQPKNDKGEMIDPNTKHVLKPGG